MIKIKKDVFYFVGGFMLLALIYYLSDRFLGKKEGFQPISTCARDPYRDGYKTYYKTLDEKMCAQTDYCQVERDKKGRIEFAICVTKPIFTGA